MRMARHDRRECTSLRNDAPPRWGRASHVITLTDYMRATAARRRTRFAAATRLPISSGCLRFAPRLLLRTGNRPPRCAHNNFFIFVSARRGATLNRFCLAYNFWRRAKSKILRAAISHAAKVWLHLPLLRGKAATRRRANE